MLVPGSGDVSFCGVVLNMTLRRGNPGYDHGRLGSAPLGVDDVMCSGKEE